MYCGNSEKKKNQREETTGGYIPQKGLGGAGLGREVREVREDFLEETTFSFFGLCWVFVILWRVHCGPWASVVAVSGIHVP